MEISRIKYLREQLEKEQISYLELAEIEDAFANIPTINNIEKPILADDMLDELESGVSELEWIIYDWAPSDRAIKPLVERIKNVGRKEDIPVQVRV